MPAIRPTQSLRSARRTQFMNVRFLWSAAFALVVPCSTLAVGGIWAPSPQVSVLTIFMNTKDASRSSGFGDIGDGTSWWTSADAQYRLGALPGGVGAGAVYAFDGDFAGLGYFYNRVQEPGTITGSRLDRATQGLEFYYNISIAQSAALALDFQWSESAFAQVDDAVILGVRPDLRF